MATVRILLGLVCFTVIGGNRQYDGSDVSRRILSIAGKELGVREATGRNDGERVEAYLAVAGLKKGQPYCAAFISWVFKQTGYTMPRTGWSPALFPPGSLVTMGKPGHIFGIYFPVLKRIAHCGFVTKVNGDWVESIEANTNLNGSREGDGVHRRLRHIKTIYRFADWIIMK